ncbi:MAG: heme NO-binding domain-containing protein [Phycisphaerales bacterium]|nr:heme NO-binding domain-containing protein [Phycisphaerales bacterium]
MYGLINIAIRDLVTSQFGQQQWGSILARAEVDDEHFLRMKAGDDAATYAFVGAASEELDSAGKTLPEFLQNRDQLHTRVGMTNPDLRPQKCSCKEITEERPVPHCRSSRPGLHDLVIGLLGGLRNRFKVAAEAKQLASKDDEGNSSTFHVSWS